MIADGPRIVLQGVSKAYRRGHADGGGRRAALRAALTLGSRGRDEFWALRDVDLAVSAGECVGLIGANGAGKSTLLRLAAGIGVPTHGSVSVSANTASVLSLGHTFDPDLTGAENVLITTALSGLSAREARRALPAILAFAELEQFAAAPVRTYSSGMRLRLAMAVTFQLEPSALLLDEVIAVGDLRFQDRCLQHLSGLRETGTSILMASHSLDHVLRECDRAVWLEHGRMRAQGDPHQVVERYRDAMRQATLAVTPEATGEEAHLRLGDNRLGSQEAVLEDVRVLVEGRPSRTISPGGELEIRFVLRRAREAVIPSPRLSVTVVRSGDGFVCFDASTESEGVRVGDLDGPRKGSVILERVDLVPGRYSLCLGVHETGWAHAYDYHHAAYDFEVAGPAGSSGVLRLPCRWTFGT